MFCIDSLHKRSYPVTQAQNKVFTKKEKKIQWSFMPFTQEAWKDLQLVPHFFFPFGIQSIREGELIQHMEFREINSQALCVVSEENNTLKQWSRIKAEACLMMFYLLPEQLDAAETKTRSAASTII